MHAGGRGGVRQVRACFRELVRRLDIDAIVLADGGTDILTRGDESGLGTPEEDMTTLAAVARLDVPERLVVSLGFGVDAHHGVCGAHVLENIAELQRHGAYLGALSIPSDSSVARRYLDAVAHARADTERPSIVNESVAAALRGDFGDVPVDERTATGELFVNPLMAVYLSFDLVGLARQVRYLDRLEGAGSLFEVAARISEFRDEHEARRPWRTYPR